MKNSISTVGALDTLPPMGTLVAPPAASPGIAGPAVQPAPASDSNEKLYYALAGGIAGLVFGYLIAYQSPAATSTGSSEKA